MNSRFRAPPRTFTLAAALTLGLGVSHAVAAETGPWDGAHVGLIAGVQHASTRYALPGDTADALQSDHAGKSIWSGGGLIGFDRQLSDLVVGVDLEAVGGGNREGVTACTVPDGCWVPTHDSFTTLNRFKESAHGRLRVRLGLPRGDNLFYVAAGYSLARTRLDLVGLCFNPGNPTTPLVFNFSRSKTISGFNLGAGVERRLSDRLSVRAEYVFDDFGHQLYRGDGTEWNDRRIRVHNSDAQVAVSYRF